MLAKKYRLLSTTKFQHAKLYQSSYFSLRYVKSENNHSTFGFIVTKKVDKRAVIRNEIKRRFRACIEEKLEQIVKGYHFLFVIKKEALSVNKEELCKHIQEQLKKEELLIA